MIDPHDLTDRQRQHLLERYHVDVYDTGQVSDTITFHALAAMLWPGLAAGLAFDASAPFASAACWAAILFMLCWSCIEIILLVFACRTDRGRFLEQVVWRKMLLDHIGTSTPLPRKIVVLVGRCVGGLLMLWAGYNGLASTFFAMLLTGIVVIQIEHRLVQRELARIA